MKNYIGLDAHSKTCTFVSMDRDGNTLAQGTFKTSDRNLVGALKSLEGPKALVVEESNLAQWIYVVAKEHVDELIVCNPVYLPRKSGPKNDFRDAVHLANQLRTNNLSSVHHEESFLMGLRTMVSQYEDIVVQNVRLVNQYKSLLRSENIATETAYLTLLNNEKTKEIKNATTRFVAEGIHCQLVELQSQRERYVAQFKLNLKADKTLKNLASIPGIGEVRANVIAAYVCSGSRFVNKHKLWAYAMLVRHEHESDGHVLRRRTPYGRTELKNAYMGAAQRIATSSKETGLKKFYDDLLSKRGYDEAGGQGANLEAICRVLELNWRAVYRWRSGKHEKPHHGGGGGHNKITPLEEKRVVALAKKLPQLRCRRISYSLERKGVAFIGKTKVAEILKAHGLNHEFVRGNRPEAREPEEMLSHEPWRRNLIWGMDWTYLKILGRFWYLLIVVDWYSRKIIAWGLFPQITRFEVVACVTEAVAIEKIDQMPEGALKPRLVADHGSANIAKYTRANIEVQGLDLWLSGVNRPTGNARTERTIGTLKWEEIQLEGEYDSEDNARARLRAAIWDYNFRRPNAGNGGFAPNSVHHAGRKALTKRRKIARQEAEARRRNHWRNQEQTMLSAEPT